MLIALTAEASELLTARRDAGLGPQGLKIAAAYRHTVQRLESKMRAFKLAPIGKSIRSVAASQIRLPSLTSRHRFRAIARRSPDRSRSRQAQC